MQFSFIKFQHAALPNRTENWQAQMERKGHVPAIQVGGSGLALMILVHSSTTNIACMLLWCVEFSSAAQPSKENVSLREVEK